VALLFFISGASLAVVVMRLLRLHEEMREMRHWEPAAVTWQITHGRAPARTGSDRSWWPLSLTIPHNFRAYSHPDGALRENIVQRMLHWDAAWRGLWKGVTCGGALGGGLFLLPLLEAKSSDWQSSILCGMRLPFIAMFPIAMSISRISPYLTAEWTRPCSRAEHIRAVGLALAVSGVCMWLVASALGLVVVWCFSKEWPIGPETIRLTLLSLSGLPLFFGLITRAACDIHQGCFFVFAWGAILATLALFWMYHFAHEPTQFESDHHLLLVAFYSVPAGIGAIWWAYRGWLNYEVD
jgi:hypothetical protein